MAERVSKENFKEAVLNSDRLVLVDFYTDSCVPCKRLAPVLSQIGSQYADNIKVVKVNAAYDKELAEQYEVQATPTVVFIKNGEEKDRFRGAVKKPEIIEKIEKLI